jgi:hypothetical protein
MLTPHSGRASELYMEYSIAGLWNAVNNNQRVTASSTDGARFYYLRPACEASVDAEGETGARVQVFASTETLLRHIYNLDHSMSQMQLVLDSKHRVILNNYPITVVWILGAGQQFNMIALAVSNKEDEEFFYCCCRQRRIRCSYWNCILHSHVQCLITATQFSGLFVGAFLVLLLGIACSTCNKISKRSEDYGMSRCPK